MAKTLLLLAALLLMPAALATAQPAAEPIVIGGLFAQSGPAAVVGTPSKLVAEMTVAQLNASGGILGRPPPPRQRLQPASMRSATAKETRPVSTSGSRTKGVGASSSGRAWRAA